MMTPRERVLTAVRRHEPDRVPFELPYGSFAPDLMEVFRRETGAEDPAEYFGYPVRAVGFKWAPEEEARERYARYHEALPEGATVDDFGSASTPGSLHHFARVVSPLRHAQTAREIEEYPLPDPTEPRRWAHLADEVGEHHARDLAVMGGLERTIFEVSWAIRGLEETLMDLYAAPEMVEALFERITELRTVQARQLAEAGVDILRLGDDISGQNGMMFDLETWARYFKGRLARVIAAAKEAKPDIEIHYHSDGNCSAAVPALIEIGVTILNPVQPECMDPAEMKRLYGDRLAFW
jgi:uroporphyrinogen decarboxylase